ncbi:UPF0220-domain-containing protein [Piromyces finnis]|uniref:UPF0220-domain-containing protein n=1 Tax=Piromyces finnis TaxID=1754191 RepID=A0A1Y1VF39_9FUNG|nr:UPF0220-domain-containing protein [Piromyces finnis]|eukprot:ORX54726.1 UPF0220-domain-containing protein [Piromyces finnis]
MSTRYQPLDMYNTVNTEYSSPFNFDISKYCFCIYNILPSRSTIVGYTSGILFTVGWWFFFDGLIYSKYNNFENEKHVSIGIWDWLPGIISTLALIIINLINQEALNGDGDYEYSRDAKLCAFIGVSLALAALGSSLTIFIMEYVIPHLDSQAIYCGSTIVIQNVLIFVSSMVFWFGRNSEEDNIW